MHDATAFRALGSGRLLALGGVGLVALGMLVGEIYAIYISHVANGIIGQNWLGVVEAVNTDPAQMSQHFAVIEDLAEKRGRTMHAHSHLAAFGLLALVLALLQPKLAQESAARFRIGLAYLTGAGLQVAGTYVSYYAGPAFLYVADLGGLLAIGAVAATLWGLSGWFASREPAAEFLAEQLSSPASRFLVKGGLLLVLLGMVFGLYYAWELVSADEPGVYAAVQGAATATASGDVGLAGEQIQMFKRMQSKIAITAAAHSHAVEFGFLMLLLAFVQRFVMLSDPWRLRWARGFAIGAFALPVCVFLATKYGLRAAAFSDLFGSIALVSLTAMLFGMIRHGGAVDASQRSESS
ncbi:hypothetical protein [Elongatibacter sediminis]|uniref:Uncharacterized protein n=1 Tax=Elongatibacter sediminis TaxID=3119006 RepID=A0AAW9RQ65_9GAMM